MPKGLSLKTSAATFAQMDGSNFSTAGLEATQKIGNGSLGIYTGIGTEFHNNTTGFIGDIKGSVPYGQSQLSGSFRLRNNIKEDSKTLQVRAMPLNLSIKTGQNTKLYATPYAQTKYNYETNKFGDINLGIYAGASTQICKTKSNTVNGFIEYQAYDILGKFNPHNQSINAGISVSL